jgi:hypothetical protein
MLFLNLILIFLRETTKHFLLQNVTYGPGQKVAKYCDIVLEINHQNDYTSVRYFKSRKPLYILDLTDKLNLP